MKGKNSLQMPSSEIRQRLCSLIFSSPGLHFREIQRRTKTSTGQLTHHLDCLKSAGLLKTTSDGEYVRFYASKYADSEEKAILELARRKSIRHLLLILLENGCSNHGQLVSKTGLAPSTVSWHLNRLTARGVLLRHNSSRNSVYSIKQPDIVKRVLVKYKGSFLDGLIDNFIKTWSR